MEYRRRYFDGEVTSPQISSEAVTEDKIADNAVTSAKITDETITGADIGAGQVQTQDIADKAVTAAKLADDVVVTPLPDNAVTTPKIADNAVITQKIAANAIDADRIAQGAVTSLKIADGAVTNSKIGTNAVTASKIAANAVGASEIQNGSVTPEKLSFVPGGAVRPLVPPVTTDEIGDGQVTSAKIGELQVISSKLQDNAVTTEKIQDASITPEKLSPTIQLGDRMTFLTPSIVVLYLTAQSSPISETEIDLSVIVPTGTKAVIARAQIYTESAAPGNTQFIMHLRKPGVGGEPSVRVGQLTATSREAENDGFCPVDANRRITYQIETGPGVGNTTATFIVVVTGYIVQRED